jgi:hypothetical protein
MASPQHAIIYEVSFGTAFPLVGVIVVVLSFKIYF